MCPITVCKVSDPLQLLKLHNWMRGHHSITQPLNKLPGLYSSSGEKADRINECQQFSHFPCSDGFSCIAGLVSCGENIAYGFSTIRSVFNAWAHSPGHRNNILNPSWKWYGSGYRRYGTFPYLWVVKMGAGPGASNVQGVTLPGPLIGPDTKGKAVGS